MYSAASHGLLRSGWWVPGGLAAALAVAMVPAVVVGFLRLIDASSSDVPVTDFNGSALAAAIVTALAGLIAYWLTRFSFLFFTVVTAILVARPVPRGRRELDRAATTAQPRRSSRAADRDRRCLPGRLRPAP